ncbi:MAG: nodulation protein NfeD [Paludibacteraceae bacterium]|nr:nodulation protein NfeD [Paludibacteraceae bacterium]
MKKTLITFILCIIHCTLTLAQTIYKFAIHDEINSKTWIYTKEALNEANTLSPDLIILHLNTYGGEVVYADSIRTAILRTETPIVAYIDNNAASAGALISIACDRIYMRSGSQIGAATVVSGVDGSKMPDKYQSYMRATMRATAESHGKDSLGRWRRDPLIAEAMVDESVYIPGIIDTGKILTFTTKEAIEYHYCEAEVDNLDQLLIAEGYTPEQCTITEYKPSLYDKLKGTLMGTALRSILIMLIIGGIYYELQQPGIGFPLAVAITAAVLYFAPLYLDGLAAYWEIAVFIIGIALILLELFIFPGFGVAGISGILCVLFALTTSMLNNDFFDFTPIHIPDLNQALLTVFLGLIFGTALIIYLVSKIGTKGIFGRLALAKEQSMDEGYVGVPTEQISIVGSEGIATTDLRPSGKVIIDGHHYDAVSHFGDFIEKGTPIIITKYEATQLYVRKK